MTDTLVAPRGGEELFGVPVVCRGLRLGHVTDVVVDGPRVIGFEVLCGDGAQRFLPNAAADVSRSAIEVSSALALLERRDAQFYFERGTRLSAPTG